MSTPGELKESAAINPEETQEIVVPLHIEELSVSRKRVDKGRVRISTVTRQTEAVVNELLAHEYIEVDRIPIGKPVASAPPVREEGDTIIIPIVEETLVIERRLVVKEEVHVKRLRRTEEYRESVMLRKQEALVTRIPAEESTAGEESGG